MPSFLLREKYDVQHGGLSRTTTIHAPQPPPSVIIPSRVKKTPSQPFLPGPEQDVKLLQDVTSPASRAEHEGDPENVDGWELDFEIGEFRGPGSEERLTQAHSKGTPSTQPSDRARKGGTTGRQRVGGNDVKTEEHLGTMECIEGEGPSAASSLDGAVCTVNLQVHAVHTLCPEAFSEKGSVPQRDCGENKEECTSGYDEKGCANHTVHAQKGPAKITSESCYDRMAVLCSCVSPWGPGTLDRVPLSERTDNPQMGRAEERSLREASPREIHHSPVTSSHLRKDSGQGVLHLPKTAPSGQTGGSDSIDVFVEKGSGNTVGGVRLPVSYHRSHDGTYSQCGSVHQRATVCGYDAKPAGEPSTKRDVQETCRGVAGKEFENEIKGDQFFSFRPGQDVKRPTASFLEGIKNDVQHGGITLTPVPTPTPTPVADITLSDAVPGGQPEVDNELFEDSAWRRLAFENALNKSVQNVLSQPRPFPGRTFLCSEAPPVLSSEGCLRNVSVWDAPEPWIMSPLTFSDSEVELLRNPGDEMEFHTVFFSSKTKSNILVKLNANGDFVRLRPPRGPCALPLAPISSSRIDLAAMRALPIPPTREYNEFLSWIETDRVESILRSHPDLTSTQCRVRQRVSRHLLGDVPALLHQRILGEGNVSPFAVTIPIFKVEKSGRIDSRLIGDCRELNDLLPKPGPMGLPSLHHVLKRLLSMNWLQQKDAKSFFYQFPLPESLSSIMVSRVAAARGPFEVLFWQVMAMGLSFAPGVAQQAANHICRNTLDPQKDEALEAWVDNFLFGTKTEEEMRDLDLRFEAVRQKVNMEMKSSEPAARVLRCLGLLLDVSSENVEEHFAALDEDFVSALAGYAKNIRENMTPREFFQVFGSLMWANFSIMRQPLARWSAALDQIRETARQMYKNPEAWDLPGRVPSIVQLELAEMIDMAKVSKITLRDLCYPVAKSTQWSDACSSCFGYLRYSEGAVYGLSRSFEGLDIYTAELLAGADCIASSLDVPLQIMDNQPAIRALLKGHSTTRAGNLILRRLWESYARSTAYVSWAPSGCNHSDPISRGCGRYPVTRQCGSPCIHVRPPEPLRWRPRPLRN